MVYTPSVVVVADASSPVSELVAVTIAPGTTSPFGSETRPVIVARNSWAAAALVRNIVRTNVRRGTIGRAGIHIRTCLQTIDDKIQPALLAHALQAVQVVVPIDPCRSNSIHTTGRGP